MNTNVKEIAPKTDQPPIYEKREYSLNINT